MTLKMLVKRSEILNERMYRMDLDGKSDSYIASKLWRNSRLFYNNHNKFLCHETFIQRMGAAKPSQIIRRKDMHIVACVQNDRYISAVDIRND